MSKKTDSILPPPNADLVIKPTSQGVGERLVAGTLAMLYSINELPPIDFQLYSPGKGEPTGRKDLLQYIMKELDEGTDWIKQSKDLIKVESEIVFEGKGDYSPDSEAKVDCAVFGRRRDGQSVFPIEVKMGLSGQAERWSAFRNHNLHPDPKFECGVRFKKTPGSTVLRGSVPALIAGAISKDPSIDERRSELEGVMNVLRVVSGKTDKGVENYGTPGKSWGLCVMKSAFKVGADESALECLGDKEIAIFTYKALLNAIGAEATRTGGRPEIIDEFNKIIEKICQPFYFKDLFRDIDSQ